MQTSNRFLDDLAKVANGAATTLTGIKDEIDQMVRQRIERFLADSELVSREEFEAVRDMAATARAQQETLETRVADLEARLAAVEPKAGARKRTAKKSTAKKTSRRTSSAKRAKTASGGSTG